MRKGLSYLAYGVAAGVVLVGASHDALRAAGSSTRDKLAIAIEAKAVAEVLPIHKAQLMSYLKLLNVPVGLLINFNELKLTDGVHRLILPGSNR